MLWDEISKCTGNKREVEDNSDASRKIVVGKWMYGIRTVAARL